jgi:asparaginyl-tRNA synthetase
MRTHVEPFASLLRFRSRLTHTIHEFFMNNHFTQVHTPIITSNNCEGGCETFQVTTNPQDKSFTDTSSLQKLHDQQQRAVAKEAKTPASPDAVLSNENLKQFFLRPAYLTASAQLHLEAMTTTLGNVYTLSPTFRAEKSLTRHHLAEFYMLEAELVDMNNLEQLLTFVERLVRDVALRTYQSFDKCDMALIVAAHPEQAKLVKEEKYDHVRFVTGLLESDAKFVRISYTDAVKTLNELLSSGNKTAKRAVKKRIEFGEDLNKEQEKLLVEHFNQTPVFVTHYPTRLKPFYMRQNAADASVVDNFDLLAPRVGEIVGGSLREYRVDVLEGRIREAGLDVELFKQYVETKRYGAMRMGGFGIGLERLIQLLANVENIRDTCAFPRSLYNCKM